MGAAGGVAQWVGYRYGRNFLGPLPSLLIGDLPGLSAHPSRIIPSSFWVQILPPPLANCGKVTYAVCASVCKTPGSRRLNEAIFVKHLPEHTVNMVRAFARSKPSAPGADPIVHLQIKGQGERQQHLFEIKKEELFGKRHSGRSPSSQRPD